MQAAQLWLTPSECRQAVEAAVKTMDSAVVVSVDQVGYVAFGAVDLTRGQATQIGHALSSLGWVRIEKRLESPRYLWRRP